MAPEIKINYIKIHGNRVLRQSKERKCPETPAGMKQRRKTGHEWRGGGPGSSDPGERYLDHRLSHSQSQVLPTNDHDMTTPEPD